MPDLTTYTGNVGLGLGGNADVPITTAPVLDNVNKLGNDIVAYNHANNVALFNQKIKDRDTLYQTLNSGEGQVGLMREEDRPVYNAAKDDANKAFLDLTKNGGINNPQAVADYRKKIDYLNQVSTQAQARYKLIGDEEQAIGNETRTPIRQARQKNLQAWSSDFWATPKPYQQMQDYDPTTDFSAKYNNGSFTGTSTSPTQTTDWKTVTDKNGKIITKNTEKTAPLKGKQPLTGDVQLDANGEPYNIEKGAKYDFNKTLFNATTDYTENKDFGAEKQRTFLNDVESLAAPQQQEFLGTILSKAQQYNAENGFVPDANGNYPQGAINIDRLRSQFVPRDPNDMSKGFHVALAPPELAALYSLATVNKFVQGDTKVFNKDYADALNKKRAERDKSALGWAKLNFAESKETAGAQSVLDEATDIINKGTKTTAQNFDNRGKNKQVLEIADPNILKQFSAIDKDGQLVKTPDVVQFDKDKGQLYLTYYTKSGNGTVQLDSKGDPFVDQRIPLNEKTWLTEITKRQNPNKDIGIINNLVDRALKANGNSLYKLSQKYSGKQEDTDINSLRKKYNY